MVKRSDCGLLDGKEEVRDFLNGMSDYKLRKFIALGMPVVIDNGGRWLAHKENIDAWFRHFTCKRVSLKEASQAQ